VASRRARGNQCQRPAGLMGRFVLWNMNSRHSKVTDWGLSHISINKRDTILDAGCGGGRTVNKLAAMASEGKVYGIDFSGASVAFAKRINRQWIDTGRAEIREASVSQLPFSVTIRGIVARPSVEFCNAILKNPETKRSSLGCSYYFGEQPRGSQRKISRSIIRFATESPDH
jgi:SAM-dependent methyltransferase